jgi:hypothetical protein
MFRTRRIFFHPGCQARESKIFVCLGCCGSSFVVRLRGSCWERFCLGNMRSPSRPHQARCRACLQTEACCASPHSFPRGLLRCRTRLPHDQPSPVPAHRRLLRLRSHKWRRIAKCRVYSPRTHTNSLTDAADFCSAAFSSAVSLIWMISSTPFAPSLTGTPTKWPLIPYSPSR